MEDRRFKVEVSDEAGSYVSESTSSSADGLDTQAHVDRQANTFSRSAVTSVGWVCPSKEAEEAKVAEAIIHALRQESHENWQRVKVEDPPDIRLRAPGREDLDIEVTHLDRAAIAGVYATGAFHGAQLATDIGIMLTQAIDAKTRKYEPQFRRQLALAVQIPLAVGRTFESELRRAAAASADDFREIWLVADSEAMRLRP
ncbi:MAG TPA: hypothetical protein VFT22_10305 [Kofleriaceae bacterium]|nr:hypothetical protein [Kofleriaceae bacterium]